MSRTRKSLAIAALALVGLASTSMFEKANAGWYDYNGYYHPCFYTAYGVECY
jgi:hypothetical protein